MEKDTDEIEKEDMEQQNTDNKEELKETEINVDKKLETEKIQKQDEIKENKELEQEKADIKEETKETEITKKKISVKLIVTITLIIIILLFLSTIFAIVNINNTNIIKGVYIENINLSNISKEETINIINEKIDSIETIDLNCGEYSTIVKIEEVGLEINSKDAINNAINLGKTNNIIVDNYSILKANLFKTKFDLDIKIDEEKFKETVKNIQAEIPEAVKEYSYEVKNDELIITNGKAGNSINEEELKEEIIKNIKEKFDSVENSITIPLKHSEPQDIDIEKIYNEIHKEAKDAYIEENPFKLHKEENGVDFNITIEEAKQILKEEKENYKIPLKITKPKVAVKDLGNKLFKQTLAKYTTIYDAGNTNRSHNIALAAKTINGTILLPGETFSYNGILGNTNKEKGYKVGTAYVGGKVVESYGGGICQVSSTLYNSVLYANLGIVERHNHSYVVNYVPAGRDATVAYGGKDFKFKNTRQYPIKIVASAKNGVVSISIMGIKEEKEYEIVLTSTVLSTTPRTIVYENNSSLEEGKEKIIQKGYDGKKSIAYKIVKYNGKTISKTVLSKDTYKPMNRIIQIGTKKVSTPVNTVPINTETENKPETNINNNI